MQTPPPPRYRVTERGRRLEVVDTWRDPAAAPSALVARGPADGARSDMVGRTQARSHEILELKSPLPAGTGPAPGTTLRTLSLFDAKAPRVIPLDAASWRTMLTAISKEDERAPSIEGIDTDPRSVETPPDFLGLGDFLVTID